METYTQFGRRLPPEMQASSGRKMTATHGRTGYSRHAYTVLQSVRGDALMSDHTMPEKSRSSGPKWNLAALFVVTEQSNGGL